MNVECNVEHCRFSGNIIIAKLGNEEKKREVMRGKNKLAGGNVFIEHDLTWEERKVQEKIRSWAKEQKQKGENVKIEIDKIRINGIWKYWNALVKNNNRMSINIEEKEKNFV